MYNSETTIFFQQTDIYVDVAIVGMILLNT